MYRYLAVNQQDQKFQFKQQRHTVCSVFIRSFAPAVILRWENDNKHDNEIECKTNGYMRDHVAKVLNRLLQW